MECFLAVARLGNVSRAAEEMYLTQPTLTARLKGLEEDLGDQLFVRTSRGMRLTEAGKEFVPYAERCLASLEEGRQRLRELRALRGDGWLVGHRRGLAPTRCRRFWSGSRRRTRGCRSLLELVTRRTF